MIDYNYYTQLNDKDLEKILSHIKNIQHLRQNEFENNFFNADIEKVSNVLPAINKDKLLNTFNSYTSHFDDSEKNIEFYFFLKQNEHTKNFDFSSLEHDICWKYPSIDLFEKIKNKLPDTFESFKQNSFQYHDKEFIGYLDNYNFIDFESVKQSHRISEEMLDYMLDNNMFKSFDDFPFNKWFSDFSEESLSKVRQHFNLPLLNLENIYSSVSIMDSKDYMKNVFKYNSPEFLENFYVTPFFIQEISKTVDKVSDKTKPLDFILKTYELIKQQPEEQQDNLLALLKSEVKKPKNKEMMEKIQMNFNMNNKLPEKNIKSPSIKI